MKNRTFICFLIASLTIFSNQAFSQLLSIDSVKLIPANPTSNDVLKVVCYTTFSSGSCSLNSFHSEQQGNNILLMLDYNVGMATYICHSVDTILLTNPGAGDFGLKTTITMNEGDIVYDHNDLPFIVDPYLGTPEFESRTFQIYPNPFENELKFKVNFSAEKLEIHTISGQQIPLSGSFSDPMNVDVSNLEKGIYIITLVDKSGNRFTQKAVKQTH